MDYIFSTNEILNFILAFFRDGFHEQDIQFNM